MLHPWYGEMVMQRSYHAFYVFRAPGGWHLNLVSLETGGCMPLGKVIGGEVMAVDARHWLWRAHCREFVARVRRMWEVENRMPTCYVGCMEEKKRARKPRRDERMVEKVRELKEVQGLSYREIGKRLKKDPTQIYRWHSYSRELAVDK